MVGAPAAGGASMNSMSWLPMPLQAMTTFAALALGFGVVVGTALSPSLQNLLAAPAQVAQAPPPAEPAPPATGGGGGGGPVVTGPAVSGTTAATVTTPSSGGGGGGGGGKKKKEPKEKPDFISGTVVHTNPVARSYTITSGGGLSSIHAVSLPAVGTNVKVPIIQLHNRTYGEDGKRQLMGAATQATFSGVVTDSRNDTTPSGPPDTYTVSARGSSILVHSPPDPTGLAEPPAIGKLVTTTVDIRDAAPTPLPSDPGPPPTCAPPSVPLPDPALTFPKGLHQVAPGSLIVDPVSNIEATEVETVIQALCPGTPGQFLLSSDDVREGKTDVELTNGGIDMTRLSAGTAVIASVSIVGDRPSGQEARRPHRRRQRPGRGTGRRSRERAGRPGAGRPPQ